jgi:hypothetical protein
MKYNVQDLGVVFQAVSPTKYEIYEILRVKAARIENEE